MAKPKLLNRCSLVADFYVSSPPVKIVTKCWCFSDPQSCSYFVPPKTKQLDDYEDCRCKYCRGWDEFCVSPEARVDAAKRVIKALKERVIDKKGKK